ncbi:MAG: glycosyltransferase family 2 protein [Pseudolabrys sp.]|nr:glycosyltransferase family 2 protein [Pseudolabrys sp.]
MAQAETASPPLLTIAIPTFNRVAYLRVALEQLRAERLALSADQRDKVEILVSDNASPDGTPALIAEMIDGGLPVRYVRNEANLGSDENIAQCFNLARGDYVIIMGDDDVLLDGTLSWLLETLKSRRYGVVSLRAFGFDNDFRQEQPPPWGRERVFNDPGRFLAAVGAQLTLISSCAIHKAAMPNVNARAFCGGQLVQLHLVIEAAAGGPENLYCEPYKVACKRNNSGDYNFSTVFVREFGRVLDSYRDRIISEQDIRAIERRMIVNYYPFYLLKLRLRDEGGIRAHADVFRERFESHLLYAVMLAPIARLPRPLGLAWGFAMTALGRAFSGDLPRGVAWAWHRLQSR